MGAVSLSAALINCSAALLRRLPAGFAALRQLKDLLELFARLACLSEVGKALSCDQALALALILAPGWLSRVIHRRVVDASFFVF